MESFLSIFDNFSSPLPPPLLLVVCFYLVVIQSIKIFSQIVTLISSYRITFLRSRHCRLNIHFYYGREEIFTSTIDRQERQCEIQSDESSLSKRIK